MAVSVTTSLPLADPVYCTPNVPVFDPDAGTIALPMAELIDQPVAFVTETVSVALAPCCSEEGPLIDGTAPGAMLRTVTVSSPTPQLFAACAEYAMLLVEPTDVLPEPGSDVPIPSIETEAWGSDACHDSVTAVPEQTLFLDKESVTLGRVQAPADPDVPGATARRRAAAGGGFGRLIGAKLIAVTGWSSIPFGAAPRCP